MLKINCKLLGLMMLKRESVDFKLIRSSRYCTMRIISAPGVWATVYRSRLAQFASFRTAILFPEMLLGLDQARVFSVFDRENIRAYASVSIQAVMPKAFRLLDHTGHRIEYNCKEDILKFEEDYHDDKALGQMVITDDFTSGNMNFFSLPLFYNKSEALKYANQMLETKLGAI
jgi:hypothetical protein